MLKVETLEDHTNLEGNLDVYAIMLEPGWSIKLVACSDGGRPTFPPGAATAVDTNEPCLA